MEPPDLIPEERNFVAPQPEAAPSNVSRRKQARVIIPKIADIAEYIDHLQMQNHLPSYNVPEKIVMALDCSQEQRLTHFIGEEEDQISPFGALKAAVEMFVRLKQRQNKHHQFALIDLKQSTSGTMFGFTSDLQQFMCKLYTLHECHTADTFDITSIFTSVIDRIKTCDFYKNQAIPPPYVVRVILFYNRSHSLPVLNPSQNIKELLNCPYFFFDVLAAHEKVSDRNQCREIFKRLQNIDMKGYSYFFNVGRDMDALTRSILRLTGHPLQRPLQSIADYSL